MLMHASVQAVTELCSIAEASFGPYGLDQLCRDDDLGHLLMTSHGGTLLESITVADPVARALLEAVRDHAFREGDGSTALLLSAGAALHTAIREAAALGHGPTGLHTLLTALQPVAAIWLPEALENLLQGSVIRASILPSPAPSQGPGLASNGPTGPALISALIATCLGHKLEPSLAAALISSLPSIVLREMAACGAATPAEALRCLDQLIQGGAGTAAAAVAVLPGGVVSDSRLVEGMALTQGTWLEAQRRAAGMGSEAGARRLGAGGLVAWPLARNTKFAISTDSLDPLDLTPGGLKLQAADGDAAAAQGGLLEWRRAFLEAALARLRDRGCGVLITAQTVPADLAEVFAASGMVVLHWVSDTDVRRLVPRAHLGGSGGPAAPSWAQTCRLGICGELVELMAVGQREGVLVLRGVRPDTDTQGPASTSSTEQPARPEPLTLLLRGAPEIGREARRWASRALKVVRAAVEEGEAGGAAALEVEPAGLAKECALWRLAARLTERALHGNPIAVAASNLGRPGLPALPAPALAAAFRVVEAAAGAPISALLASSPNIPTVYRGRDLSSSDALRELHKDSQRHSSDRRSLLASLTAVRAVMEAGQGPAAASDLNPDGSAALGGGDLRVGPLGLVAPFAAPLRKKGLDGADLLIDSPAGWSLLEPRSAFSRRILGAVQAAVQFLRVDIVVPASLPIRTLTASRRGLTTSLSLFMWETDLLASRSPLLTLLGNSPRGRNTFVPERLTIGDSYSHICASPDRAWGPTDFVSDGYANKAGLHYGAGSSLHQKTVGTRGTYRASSIPAEERLSLTRDLEARLRGARRVALRESGPVPVSASASASHRTTPRPLPLFSRLLLSEGSIRVIGATATAPYPEGVVPPQHLEGLDNRLLLGLTPALLIGGLQPMTPVGQAEPLPPQVEPPQAEAEVERGLAASIAARAVAAAAAAAEVEQPPAGPLTGRGIDAPEAEGTPIAFGEEGPVIVRRGARVHVMQGAAGLPNTTWAIPGSLVQLVFPPALPVAPSRDSQAPMAPTSEEVSRGSARPPQAQVIELLVLHAGPASTSESPDQGGPQGSPQESAADADSYWTPEAVMARVRPRIWTDRGLEIFPMDVCCVVDPPLDPPPQEIAVRSGCGVEGLEQLAVGAFGECGRESGCGTDESTHSHASKFEAGPDTEASLGPGPSSSIPRPLTQAEEAPTMAPGSFPRQHSGSPPGSPSVGGAWPPDASSGLPAVSAPRGSSFTTQGPAQAWRESREGHSPSYGSVVGSPDAGRNGSAALVVTDPGLEQGPETPPAEAPNPLHSSPVFQSPGRRVLWSISLNPLSVQDARLPPPPGQTRNGGAARAESESGDSDAAPAGLGLAVAFTGSHMCDVSPLAYVPVLPDAAAADLMSLAQQGSYDSIYPACISGLSMDLFVALGAIRDSLEDQAASSGAPPSDSDQEASAAVVRQALGELIRSMLEFCEQAQLPSLAAYLVDLAQHGGLVIGPDLGPFSEVLPGQPRPTAAVTSSPEALVENVAPERQFESPTPTRRDLEERGPTLHSAPLSPVPTEPVHATETPRTPPVLPSLSASFWPSHAAVAPVAPVAAAAASPVPQVPSPPAAPPCNRPVDSPAAAWGFANAGQVEAASALLIGDCEPRTEALPQPPQPSAWGPRGPGPTPHGALDSLDLDAAGTRAGESPRGAAQDVRALAAPHVASDSGPELPMVAGGGRMGSESEQRPGQPLSKESAGPWRRLRLILGRLCPSSCLS